MMETFAREVSNVSGRSWARQIRERSARRSVSKTGMDPLSAKSELRPSLPQSVLRFQASLESCIFNPAPLPGNTKGLCFHCLFSFIHNTADCFGKIPDPFRIQIYENLF